MGVYLHGFLDTAASPKATSTQEVSSLKVTSRVLSSFDTGQSLVLGPLGTQGYQERVSLP
ncbi:hypothetical protein ACRRTK_008005 [Alexandromys fortis]